MNAISPPFPDTKKSGLAIWSMVCGILAVVLSVACVGPLFAIPAVICGPVVRYPVAVSHLAV
jgi:hypothetical protein